MFLRRIDGRQACGDCGLLGTQCDLSVTISGVEADVAKPCPNDVNFDTSFQQVDGRAVAECVREQPVMLLSQSAAVQRSCVTFYDFVDSKSCERLPLLGEEHRSGFLSWADNTTVL